MVRSTGWTIHHTSKIVHRLLLLAMGFLVVGSCLLAAAAWRLAQGPIDLGWLANPVRAALIDDTAPMRLSFEGLALDWEGFHKGVDHPLNLRVSDISVTDPTGHRLVTAPDAHLTFSIAGLLLGRIVPRTIEVDQAEIAITREAGGAVNLDWELGNDAADTGTDEFDLRQLREQLTRPASTDRGRSHGLLDQLQRAHFRNTHLALWDRQSGLVVRASDMDFDLVRNRHGQIHGALQTPLQLGNQSVAMTATIDLTPGAESSLHVDVSSFRPAAIGALPPAWATLAKVDVPIAVTATGVFDADFKPRHLQASAQLGTGQIVIGQGTFPVRSGAIVLAGTMSRIAIETAHLDLAHARDGVPEVVDITGTVAHVADRLTASLTVGLERIDIADLPRLWPAGIAKGARSWITEHITGGLATQGKAALVIEADDSLHDVVLTNGTGELDGTNAVFTWLDDVPPVEQAEVHLHLADPDTLDIQVINGHQRISNRVSDLLIKSGQMRISGLSFRDQVAMIHLQVEGQVVNALAFLSEPRLNLLAAHPIGLKPGGGDVSASLDFQFPLVTNVQIDDVDINVNAHLARLRLLDVAGGHELDDGAGDLAVNKNGLTFKGRGVLAAVPVTLDGTMDFTPGAADQIVQKITVTGQPDAAQLDAAGLPVKSVMSGPAGITAVMVQRHNGEGAVSISGDLTQTALKIGPLAWSKPSGAMASATATLLMSHDRPTKLDRIVVQGDSLFIAGSVNFTDGHIRSVLLDKIRLGRSQGHGTINITPHDDIAIVVQGSLIDLQPKLTEKVADTNTQKVNAPAWTLDARFDRALLANAESADNILAKVSGGGDSISGLDVLGATQPAGGFSIRIEPGPDQRRLLVDAKDAGRFLRGIDAVRVIEAGHLTINGRFDGQFGLYPLAGVVTIDDAVVRNSPVFGKLLQAITLYGLVDVLRGPGMSFSNIVIPFRYDGTSLVLKDAHANNPSLGITALGRIDLSSGQTSISGTIVPAYFFNSMLGQLPLVGKLFSPEKGGGVFAGRFGVEGSIEDPSISINPISALTPGFLREIFNIFDKPEAAQRAIPPKPP